MASYSRNDHYFMDTFGTLFRVTLFGESHGTAVGAVIDGTPPGLPLGPDDFAEDIGRRKTGTGRAGISSRQEDDVPEILSGTYDGCTTGAPIAVLFRNAGQRSEDYSLFERIPRPGHADFSAAVKYNYFNDPRGGGHFSGRLTLPLVAAGVVAKKAIEAVMQDYGSGCSIKAEVASVGGKTGKEEIECLLRECAASGDSVGGVVECRIAGIPAGFGEPFFDSVESLVSHAAFAIPGIRGIEFGDGFRSASMRGSEHNDPFIDSAGHTSKNGAGGINGGITNGNEIRFRVAVKPASSIGCRQETFDFVDEKMVPLEIQGRHDACIALRIPPVLEAVAAIVLADLVLRR